MKKLIITISVLLSLSAIAAPVIVWANSCTNITAGLQGWWKFDEGSGTTYNDSSGNAFNGSASGTPNPSYVTGQIGPHALSFNGSNSAMLPNVSNFNLASSSSFTATAWIKPTATSSGGQSIIDKWSGTPSMQSWYCALSGSNVIIATDGSNGYGILTGTLNVNPPNQWTFIACVYNAALPGLFVYVNGVQDPTVLTGTAFPAQVVSENPYIGIAVDGSNPFIGSLDDVRLYNTALSTTSIQTIYNYTGICYTESTFNIYLQNFFNIFEGISVNIY